MSLSDLERATVLVTGVTGFLGTAILEKLLRDVPGVRVLCLIRPGRLGAQRRVRSEVLDSPAFSQLRDGLGARFDGEAASRVVALAGDLGRAGLGLDESARSQLGEVDCVIHSAAEVSFDSPLDAALATNVGGPVRLLETVRAAGGRPAMVHVSTAYVSGVRRGLVFEGAPGGLAAAGGAHLDWRAELDAASAVRARLEAESRSPGRMRRFAAIARRGRGASGVPAGGAETERARSRWVAERLVDHGRAHARALGWSDVYTLSKSLAELAVADASSGLPLSVVRPSIIESSLREPHPGWITGLRMAEPLVLAYGRGLLPEFPGLPDGTIDLVPVDIVSNTVISAAAAPPPPDRPRVLNVGSGARNPLRFRGLFEHARDYFREHPLHDAAGAPIPVPDWSFPTGHQQRRRLGVVESGLSAVIDLVERGPAGPRMRDLHERLEGAIERVRRGRSLAEMYAVYTEMDAVFDDANTRRLDLARSAAERVLLPMDVAAIDWHDYLQGSHIPAVVELARLRRRPPRPVLPRPVELAPEHPATPLSTIPSTTGGRAPVVAVFDVEGTIADLTVVQHYVFFALDERRRREWPGFLARTALRVPDWIRIDRRQGRLDFQRHFYRQYEGLEQERLVLAARRALHEVTLPRCFPRALRRVRDHVDAGNRVLLVTGALEEVVRPLAELLEVELRAVRLSVERGRFTGDLAETPPSAEARGALVRRLAEQTGAELRSSFAYADSISDLSMLEAVGHPVPVNPDLKLAAVARRRGWRAQHWSTRDGGWRLPVVLPTGVRDPVRIPEGFR